MQPVMQVIAHNLRARRRQRGLSLSELARLAGVSKSTLSGLERAHGNPALDTLWALASALGVPFSALVHEGRQEAVQVTHASEAEIVAVHEPDIVIRLLRSRHGRGDFELYLGDFEPRARRHAPGHGPGQFEHVVVIEGHFEIGPEGASAVLGPGDCISFPVDRPHRYFALGGPGRLLVIQDYA